MSAVHGARFSSDDLEQCRVEVLVSGRTPVSSGLVEGPSERRQSAVLVVLVDAGRRLPGDAAVSREVRRGAEELGGTSGPRQEPCRRHAEVLELAGQLVRLIVTSKQRPSSNQLRHDASQTPHVHRRPVPRTQDHLNTHRVTRSSEILLVLLFALDWSTAP